MAVITARITAALGIPEAERAGMIAALATHIATTLQADPMAPSRVAAALRRTLDDALAHKDAPDRLAAVLALWDAVNARLEHSNTDIDGRL